MATTAAREPIATGSLGRRRSSVAAWVLLSAYLVLTGLAQGLYFAGGQAPSGRFQLVATLGFVLVLWHWFRCQLAPYRAHWPLDAGVLIAVFWPIAMTYFLWRHARWRGLLKLAGVVALQVASYGVAMLAALLLR